MHTARSTATLDLSCARAPSVWSQTSEVNPKRPKPLTQRAPHIFCGQQLEQNNESKDVAFARSSIRDYGRAGKLKGVTMPSGRSYQPRNPILARSLEDPATLFDCISSPARIVFIGSDPMDWFLLIICLSAAVYDQMDSLYSDRGRAPCIDPVILSNVLKGGMGSIEKCSIEYSTSVKPIEPSVNKQVFAKQDTKASVRFLSEQMLNQIRRQKRQVCAIPSLAQTNDLAIHAVGGHTCRPDMQSDTWRLKKPSFAQDSVVRSGMKTLTQLTFITRTTPCASRGLGWC